MQKRIFIVYGWGGHPGEGWFPWLKQELEARGFRVFIPKLPDAENPHKEHWVPALAQVVGIPDAQTYFVGHSMGCQTIARYLTSLPSEARVGGAVFVAGFFKKLTNLETDEDTQTIVKSWLDCPIDFADVASHLPKSIAIFSDTDPYVPMENQDDFRDHLGSKIIIEHAKGHFSGSLDKAFEVPVILESVLEIAT
ncbi:TPA: hypothetical protein DEP34_03915 [Candidatus Uhrbacteria bacterium]|uniref:Serine hydrolase family protein n=2 Tax=Candidatus Uhriibacteriota TaxID=1752732 RepID=A0A0G1Q966_9BACT|nr:MAG: hypothetical protein UX45_C0005G0037 [Candidatus Uhrbacteria bacterium GW2011_GWF2_46_218]KKU41544.1 MAG: hypothetical protein UX57_C0003G0044 [Candidatus Uhrbacteria bacterium GW2011_GWE2_46_68]HBK33545.1 hypothetical protein [Candidatus Uhrbacteria bacterium]HCB19500.1 hypothetical protein [Candidatus Uhrbacteria bacterium]